MAQKQSRRAVSIRGVTYEQVQKYCQEKELSVSSFIEQLVANFLNPGGADTAMRPFTPSGIKKEELPVVKKSLLRGGGVHSL